MKTTRREYIALCILLPIAFGFSLEAWFHAYHEPRQWVAVVTLNIVSILVIIARPSWEGFFKSPPPEEFSPGDPKDPQCHGCRWSWRVFHRHRTGTVQTIGHCKKMGHREPNCRHQEIEHPRT